MTVSSAFTPNQDKQKQIDVLTRTAFDYQLTTPLKTVSLAQEALSLSKDKANFPTGYLKGITSSHIGLSHGYLMLNKFEDALRHGLAAISFSTERQNQNQIAISHRITGYCYARLGNYPKAINHFQLTTAAGQEANNPLLKAESYRGLGEVYGEMEESQKAIQYTKMGLKIFQAADGEETGQLTCLNNLCWFHNQQGLYAQALQYGLEALTFCTTKELDFFKRIIATNIGQTYLGLKNFIQAHVHFDLALSVESITDPYTLSLLLTDIGHTYILQGELTTAEQSLTEALRFGIESENPYCEYHAHQYLSKVHKLAGNFKVALFHSEQHRIIRNKYMGEENTRHARYLEIAFNTESAERESTFFRARSRELELRVSERTHELELLSSELERAYQQEAKLSELKSQIISTVSREFRSPLSVINHSIDTLNKHYAHLSTSKRSKLHKHAQGSIFYLTDLLQDIDLVDTVKRENMRPNFATHSFGTLITQIVNDLRLDVGNPSNLFFNYQANSIVPISTDYAMLKQVIHNILSNMIKYSADASPINLSFTHEPVFSILLQDSGIGIPEADIDNIWQLFYRGSNVEQKHGLGLGLFIAQGLTEALNGTINVQSTEHVGTTFTLTFPSTILS